MDFENPARSARVDKFWAGLEKVCHALANCHPAIILQGGYRFQSAFEIKRRGMLAFMEPWVAG